MRRRPTAALVLAGWLALLLPALAADDVVAQRGPVTLSGEDVRQLLAALDPAAREAVQRSPDTLIALVRERLTQLALLHEARDKKWDARPEVVAAANQARDAAIVNSYLASVAAPDPAYPSDAEIQAVYEANKARFLVPRQYQLAQIFIAVPTGAARQADDEARKRLADLRSQAAKPRADFAALARQNSQDRPSAEKGGELNWLREDELAPEIRTAVSGLQEGAVTEPIRLADGWRILRLLATKPATTTPLADVRANLVDAMRKQRAQQNAQAYVAAALRAQPVQLDEIAIGRLATK